MKSLNQKKWNSILSTLIFLGLVHQASTSFGAGSTVNTLEKDAERFKFAHRLLHENREDRSKSRFISTFSPFSKVSTKNLGVDLLESQVAASPSLMTQLKNQARSEGRVLSESEIQAAYGKMIKSPPFEFNLDSLPEFLKNCRGFESRRISEDKQGRVTLVAIDAQEMLRHIYNSSLKVTKVTTENRAFRSERLYIPVAPRLYETNLPRRLTLGDGTKAKISYFIEVPASSIPDTRRTVDDFILVYQNADTNEVIGLDYFAVRAMVGWSKGFTTYLPSTNNSPLASAVADAPDVYTYFSCMTPQAKSTETEEPRLYPELEQPLK